MHYIVAVSGGVDSVVLLDKLSKKGEDELVVAHFDHGIRPESDADARFVAGLAKKYDLPFEVERERLGSRASEALARERRYLFLRRVAKKYHGTIVTAHHADDVIETIAINLLRGTGWRGLAVLDAPDIDRPLVTMTKAHIYNYALSHHLEWVEDETNATDAYMRNRIRRQVHASLTQEAIKQLHELSSRQRMLKQKIIEEEKAVLGDASLYSRYFFTHIDSVVAIELIRCMTSQLLTRPQASRALHDIKTAHAGTVSEVGAGIRLCFTASEFTVQIP